MGCDGGTIPRRDELVKTKKKPEQKDKDSERLYRWRHCALSQSRLRSPIVSCELGRLYNKEALLTALLEKSQSNAVTSHIRGLKDIKELKLTKNPAASPDGEASKGDAYLDTQKADHICPVTNQEMNGKTRFVFHWRCGCVMSARALSLVKSPTCLQCGADCTLEDTITLNSTNEDEQDNLHERMAARRAQAKAEKKAAKKQNNGKRSVEEASAPSAEVGTSSGSTNSKKKIKVAVNGNGMRVGGMASDILKDPSFRSVRSSGFSVAEDPKASEVFKSIFDTHKTAQKKDTAHWVTCNPHYM